MELRGDLKNFPLPDIIQLIGMGRRSGKLTIDTGTKEKSFIYFNSGQMTHARRGKIEGPPVIYGLFKEQEGQFQFHSGDNSSKRSIYADWMTIMMEAARRFDEEKRGDNGKQADTLEESENDNDAIALIKHKLGAVLESYFGRKAKKLQLELTKLEGGVETLLAFCDKVEKYVFVFIDNRKAKEVAEEMKKIIGTDKF